LIWTKGFYLVKEDLECCVEVRGFENIVIPKSRS